MAEDNSIFGDIFKGIGLGITVGYEYKLVIIMGTFLCFNFYCCNMINLTNIHLFEEYIDWSALSKNPNAIDLLEQNQDKIDWKILSRNEGAIHLLEKNQDKIDWKMLSMNENAIHLLEKNQDKINWKNLSMN